VCPHPLHVRFSPSFASRCRKPVATCRHSRHTVTKGFHCIDMFSRLVISCERSGACEVSGIICVRAHYLRHHYSWHEYLPVREARSWSTLSTPLTTSVPAKLKCNALAVKAIMYTVALHKTPNETFFRRAEPLQCISTECPRILSSLICRCSFLISARLMYMELRPYRRLKVMHPYPFHMHLHIFSDER
jgi:hypothetical protein